MAAPSINEKWWHEQMICQWNVSGGVLHEEEWGEGAGVHAVVEGLCIYRDATNTASLCIYSSAKLHWTTPPISAGRSVNTCKHHLSFWSDWICCDCMEVNMKWLDMQLLVWAVCTWWEVDYCIIHHYMHIMTHLIQYISVHWYWTKCLLDKILLIPIRTPICGFQCKHNTEVTTNSNY